MAISRSASDVAILTAVVLAGAQLYYELARGPKSSIAAKIGNDDGGTKSPGSAAAQTARIATIMPNFERALARPLFHKSRKPLPDKPPPRPAVVAVEPQSPQPPPERPKIEPPLTEFFVLSGVLVTHAKKIALLEKIAGGSVVRVEEGQELDGWRLLRLDASRATFVRAEQKIEMSLAPPAGDRASLGQTGQAMAPPPNVAIAKPAPPTNVPPPQ